MLSELAEYAHTHNLVARPGFKPKTVKAYVHLSVSGEFLGIVPREKGAEPVYAPDIGSAVNGPRYCNPLVEKAKIPLRIVENVHKDRSIPAKHAFFLFMLESGGAYEPRFLVLLCVLRCEERRKVIQEAMRHSKLKGDDPIGFVVDGMPLEQSNAYIPWWEDFRRKLSSFDSGTDLQRCLITGKLAPPLATIPKVPGLESVGGHHSGDAFLCFDKKAYQSYGLNQGANASVSEEAMVAVNAALTDLIAKAPTFGGAKQLYWYAGEIPEGLDIIDDLVNGTGLYGAEPEKEPEYKPKNRENADDVQTANAQDREVKALQSSKNLFESIFRGERPEVFSARYYILSLSGANGRMMVRGWYEGNLEELYKNIDMWVEDLMLIDPRGKGMANPPKLRALEFRLANFRYSINKKMNSHDWNNFNHDVANISGCLFTSIINGRPIPDEVAYRALQWILSAMFYVGEDGEKKLIKSESAAFQLLKAWLRRVQRQRGEKELMGESIDRSPKSVAYSCGQLMAIYEAIQQKAMSNVNASVTDRYFTAACTTPSLTIGQLAQLSLHHLSMLDAVLASYYDRLITNIAEQMEGNILPDTLNMKQQTEFTLGYYQQKAAMRTEQNRDTEV